MGLAYAAIIEIYREKRIRHRIKSSLAHTKKILDKLKTLHSVQVI
jgi:hypothetical protein